MSTVVDLTLTNYDADGAKARFEIVRGLYEEVFAEPPHSEGPDEFRLFATRWWPKQVATPRFQLTMAIEAGEPVGCMYGHRLPLDTNWWDGALEPLPDDLTTEHEGRTAAIFEMMVRRLYRRRGVAAAMHDHFLASRSEERATLLVQPENEPARRAYEKWGYRKVGQVKPARKAPVFDAMILNLA